VGTIFYHFDPGNGENEENPNAVLGFYEVRNVAQQSSPFLLGNQGRTAMAIHGNVILIHTNNIGDHHWVFGWIVSQKSYVHVRLATSPDAYCSCLFFDQHLSIYCRF
jgi:hypothetical protein